MEGNKKSEFNDCLRGLMSIGNNGRLGNMARGTSEGREWKTRIFIENQQILNKGGKLKQFQ